MAETTYTYSIASDMPGGSLNSSTLVEEIRASSIVIALERVDTDGDALDIVFKDSLSAGDRTTLDNDTTGPSGGLLAAHDNSPDVPDTQVVKLDSNDTNIVEIQEVSPSPLIYRNQAFSGLVIEAASSTGSTSLTLPYDYYLLAIEYFAGSGSGAVLGDKIGAWIDKDRDLTDFSAIGLDGTLQEDETTADAQIKVAPQDIMGGIIQPGYWLQFVSTSNPEYEVVKVVDKASGIIQLDRNLENARSTGDKIFRSITMGRDIFVFPTDVPHVYGESKIGASKIPAGWVFTITYDAADSDGRTIYLTAEGGILEA